jgi:formate-dependent nitrite reductase membrane component NrfD
VSVVPYFDNDVLLVIGVIFLGFSFPALLAAFSESRPPRMAAILFVIGGALIATVAVRSPGGISLQDVPHAFATVIGRLTQ